MVDQGIEILLVEDNANDEMLALHAFNRFGIANNVHVVRDGIEALDFIFCCGAYADRRVENPKVILMDLKLPLVDGIEVLRRIRQDPRTRLIPVVMLTSSNEERDIIETYSLGVNSYIVKPVDFEQFNEVARHLGYYWLLLNRQPTSVNGWSPEASSVLPDRMMMFTPPPAAVPLAVATVALSPEEHSREQPGVEILLIEDNANDEMLALHAFKKQHVVNNIHVVRDGAEALEYIFCTGAYAERRIENPRLILLDLKIPLIDGIEVLRRIRQDPRTRLIPVVVLTSSNEERDVIETYRLGVNSYIVKPVDFGQFNEVARHLGYYWLLLNRQPPYDPGSQPESTFHLGSV